MRCWCVHKAMWSWGGQASTWDRDELVHLIPVCSRCSRGWREEGRKSRGRGWRPGTGGWAASPVRPGGGGSRPPGNSNSAAQYPTANPHTAYGVGEATSMPGQAGTAHLSSQRAERGEGAVGASRRGNRGGVIASSAAFWPPSRPPLLEGVRVRAEPGRPLSRTHTFRRMIGQMPWVYSRKS